MKEKSKLSSIEIAITGAIIIIISIVSDIKTNDSLKSLNIHHFAVISGWSLIIIGWIGKVGNIIIDKVDSLKEIDNKRQIES